MINEIQELLELLGDTYQNVPQLSGWVNGNLYVPSSEVAGVLPIPLNVREATGMSPYDPTLATQLRSRNFLASMQFTRKPVLPVHSHAERDLFRLLIQEEKSFNPPEGGNPNWKKAVVVWNQHANAKVEISYKVSAR